MMKPILKTALSTLLLTALAGAAQAQDKVLNLYSARHYQTDEALYSNFTRITGITINRIEGKEEELLERIKNEGANSPADIFLTVDASRLAQAEQLGLFAPVKSKVLESRIPKHLRSDSWFAFSKRARVIIYNKSQFAAADVQNYEDLAMPKFKGKVCSRSGAHPYNISLMAALVAHNGEARTAEWAKGIVANFARAPKGGDTDQIKAVSAGECGVAVSNTYYLVRLLRSTKAEDKKVMDNIGIVWPNQKSYGTHVNISGGGMLKTAPHKEAAVKFMEYLVSDLAQEYFAEGNNEWPVLANAATKNEALDSLGKFKEDTLPVATLAKNATVAQKISDRSGYR